MRTWREPLRAALDGIDDFAAHLETLAAGQTGWAHADTPALVGLERWGTELATKHHAAGVAALVVAARLGLPRVLEAGADNIANMGFRAGEPSTSTDGLPVVPQVTNAFDWLEGIAFATEVAPGFDRARQLYVWDDDLRPVDDASYLWYLDVGQCCCAAILNKKGDATGDGYYEWPRETCVGRGLVVVARGLRGPGGDLAAILGEFREAYTNLPAPNPMDKLFGSRTGERSMKRWRKRAAAHTPAANKKPAANKPAANKKPAAKRKPAANKRR